MQPTQSLPSLTSAYPRTPVAASHVALAITAPEISADLGPAVARDSWGRHLCTRRVAVLSFSATAAPVTGIAVALVESEPWWGVASGPAPSDVAARGLPTLRWLRNCLAGRLTAATLSPAYARDQLLTRLDQLVAICRPGQAADVVARLGQVQQDLVGSRAIMPGTVLEKAAALCCKAIEENWSDDPKAMRTALVTLRATMGGSGTSLATALRHFSDAVRAAPTEQSTQAAPPVLLGLSTRLDKTRKACPEPG